MKNQETHHYIDFNDTLDGIFEEVIVFGAGLIGMSAIYLLRFESIHVRMCFDNSDKIMGKRIWNVVECEKPFLIDKKIPIIISLQDVEARRDIRKQCELLGYIYIYDIDIKKLYNTIDGLPDKEFLELQYYLRMDEKILNLYNPKTFNEKLQWLKLYDHDPKYTMMVDKFEVKKYIANVLDEKYVIPTLGVWDKFEDIDFEQLPDQFVLKCTHDSGSTFVVQDKKGLNLKRLEKQFMDYLNTDYYRKGREWAYKNIVPRIIAEKYMVDKNHPQLIEYKFMCFNGRVRCIFTCTDRRSKSGLKVTFYDNSWKRMPFERHYPADNKICEKPYSFTTMSQMAEKLSRNMAFARVDFYEIEGHPYFSEITLYPGCGFEEFIPEQWDEILGSWIKLPEIKNITNYK